MKTTRRTRSIHGLAGTMAVTAFALLAASSAQAQCDPFFDQTSNTAVPSLTSDYGDSQSRAENFVLTQTTDICQFTARGAWSLAVGPPFPAAPFTMIIHQDAGGAPGLPLVTNTALLTTSQNTTGNNVETTGGNFRPEREFVFDLPTPVTLAPGTYWLELFQNQGTDIFLWSQSSTPDGDNGASGSAVGLGAPGTTWTPTLNEFSLEIRGTDSVAPCATVAVGINDQLANLGGGIGVFERGWLVTATSDMDLERVETRFSGGADGRTVTVSVWDDRPVPHGTAIAPLATGTFSPINNVFAGGNLNVPVTLVNGQDYFIAFSNIAGLGENRCVPGTAFIGSEGAAVGPPAFEVPTAPTAPILNLIGCQIVPPGDPCVDGVNVVLLAADTGAVGNPSAVDLGLNTGKVGDVANKLLSLLPAGSTVEFFDVRNDANAGTTKVPTLLQLQDYDVAFVWSFDTYDANAALGNVLADYYDDGGGVVVAGNEYGGGSFSLGGRWATGGYRAIPRTGTAASSNQLVMDEIYFGPLATPPTLDEHPIVQGVGFFNGGTSSRRPSATTVLPGAIKIAGWSNAATPADHVLVATKIGAPASPARPIVDLGMAPYSNDSDATGWADGTSGLPDSEGEEILANAVLHAAGCTPFTPPPGSISNLVFNDADADGIQDGGEAGIENVTVNLLDSGQQLITSDVTDVDGLYSFGGLTPGTYFVEFDGSTFPANMFVTLPNVGGLPNDAIDSDVPQDGSNIVGPIVLNISENNDTIDLGLAVGATIGDYVWVDTDGDGIQDGSESGLDGVTVELVDDTNAVVDTDVTSGGGAYSFADVAPGDYTVRVTPLDNTWYFTRANEGGDDAEDSDILDEYLSVVGETAAFSVNVGDTDDSIDAGMFQQGSISDFVWLDINDDGIQDPGEPGLDGVNVDLVNTTLGVNTTTATAAGGAYSFGSLFPHDGYVVSFHLPAPGVPEVSLFSPANVGSDASDSDASVVVDLDTQSTGSVAVVSNTENDTVDCGMRDVTDPTATLVCDPFGVFYSCTINATETFTVTFDEPVNLDNAGNIIVTNGTVNNIVAVPSAPSDTWTFDVTAAAEGTVTVQVGVGAFDDPATNDNTATLVCSYEYDITAPAEDCGGELTNLTPSITNDQVLVFLTTFTEDVSGVDATDFSGNAAALITNIDPAAGPASTYTITVTVPGPGVYTLAWAGPTTDWIEDCAGNDFGVSYSFGQVEVIDDSVPLTGTLQYDELTGANGDLFGWSVSQSGPVSFIGTPGDDDSGLSSGSVHVAEQDNLGSHPLTQKLVATTGADAGDRFGEAVSVDGDWAIVGAAYDEAGLIGTAGSAYFFQRDEVGGIWGDGLGGTTEYQRVQSSVNGPNWSHGRAVSLQGRTAIVGVPQGAATGATALFRSGRAVIYEYDSCTELWTETEQLTAFDAAGYDGYGASVAVFGSIAIVGSPADDDLGSATGAVYAYRRSGPGVWTFDAKIVPAGGGQGDNIGTSVAMFGNIAVIGAPGDDDDAVNAGAVYVFERIGPGTWNQIGKVTASDGAMADAFGSAVAFDGLTLVVGSPLHNGTGTDSGALYSFTSAGWAQTHKFLTPLTKTGNKLGTSVGVDGRRCLGGAPYGETRVMGAPVFNSGNVSYYQLP